MNRPSSSSNVQTKKVSQSQSQSQSQLKPPEKKERNPRKERLPVNLLRGLSTRSSGSSNGSSNGSASSSNGYHRCLLSNSFSSSSSTSSSLGVYPPNGRVKSVAKTPKSAPVVTKPLIRKKPRFLEQVKLKNTVPEKSEKNPKFPRLGPSGKRPTGKSTLKPDKSSILKKQSSISGNLKLKGHKTLSRVDDSISQITPVSKLGTNSDLICSNNGDSSCQDKTPPVQASVSPEIQCGSSMTFSTSTQSQACYAAGHLLSGVSDKRKCKPKGILTVGENGSEISNPKLLNDFDESDEIELGVGNYNISLIPLPVDASVQWLLSPCDEEKDHENEKCNNGFFHGQEILSPLSDHSSTSDLCNISSGRSLSPMKATRRRTSSSLSPNELSRFRRFIQLSSCDDKASAFDITPISELNPFEHLKEVIKCQEKKGEKLSPLSNDTLGSENVIQTPESNSSFKNYHGVLSSQAEIQEKHDLVSDMESLKASLQSVSLLPSSYVSSREPSCSSFNFDSLATSSDSIDLSQFQRALIDRSSSQHTEFKTQNNKDSAFACNKTKDRDFLHTVLPYSAAESISIDGGDLICSEDSNWMDCYKNNFVEE